MESKTEEEDSTNTSGEESDHIELQNTGISRSYECVFCRRGFTTAQALGGHMNIHRKDKARTRPCKENKQGQINSYNSKLPTIFPSTYDNHQNLPPPIEDCQLELGLSVQFGTSKFSKGVESKIRVGLIEDDDDLDLELRLGHNP